MPLVRLKLADTAYDCLVLALVVDAESRERLASVIDEVALRV